MLIKEKERVVKCYQVMKEYEDLLVANKQGEVSISCTQLIECELLIEHESRLLEVRGGVL